MDVHRATQFPLAAAEQRGDCRNSTALSARAPLARSNWTASILSTLLPERLRQPIAGFINRGHQSVQFTDFLGERHCRRQPGAEQESGGRIGTLAEKSEVGI